MKLSATVIKTNFLSHILIDPECDLSQFGDVDFSSHMHVQSLRQQGGNNGEKLQWIHINAIDLYTPVQMRPADPSGRSDLSDWVTPCNMLAFNYLNFAQVGIIGENVHAVVHNNDIAGKKQVSGQPDDSGIGCLDGSSDIGAKISASVMAALLAVEQPSGAKDAGRITGKRLFETSIPQAGVATVCINSLDLFFLSRDTLLIFFAQRDLSGINAQGFAFVFPINDLQRNLCGLAAAEIRPFQLNERFFRCSV